MRAVIQQEFGGPEVLRVAEVDAPSPLPTEIVVEVRAASLNPVDAVIRSGGFPMLGQPPFTLGWDVSGVVTEVVPGVNRFKVGDEVYGMPLGLPLAGLTAWQALVDVAGVQAGQRVLVHAAGGGVGHLAVQIAKELGHMSSRRRAAVSTSSSATWVPTRSSTTAPSISPRAYTTSTWSSKASEATTASARSRFSVPADCW